MSTVDLPLRSSVPPVALEVPLPDLRPSRPYADGDFGSLLAILLRGYGLTIVTLGVYRFWMKTRIRRWYAANTYIGGDAFEYRGTGRELFIGFLIAIGILLPVYTVVVGGVYLSGVLPWQMASQVFFVVFIVLAQYASFRARRYRLTRTAWRGLTFSQTGSAWSYVGLWLVGVLATLMSLGLAFPWSRALLEGYRIRNTRFGTAEGRFTPALGRLFAWWALLWVPALAAVAVGLWLASGARGLGSLGEALIVFFGLSERHPAVVPYDAAQTGWMVLAGLGGAALWAACLWPAYRTAEFRAFTAATRIGPVAFQSGIGAGWYYFAVVRLGLMYALAGTVIAGLGGFAVYIVLSAGLAPSTAHNIGVVIGVIAYALPLITFVILREIILTQGFWRKALQTLSVTGLDDIADVIAREQSDRAVGEGFADAFELGGF